MQNLCIYIIHVIIAFIKHQNARKQIYNLTKAPCIAHHVLLNKPLLWLLATLVFRLVLCTFEYVYIYIVVTLSYQFCTHLYVFFSYLWYIVEYTGAASVQVSYFKTMEWHGWIRPYPSILHESIGIFWNISHKNSIQIRISFSINWYFTSRISVDAIRIMKIL